MKELSNNELKDLNSIIKELRDELEKEIERGRKISKAIKQYRNAPGDYPEDDHVHAVTCINDIDAPIRIRSIYVG